MAPLSETHTKSTTVIKLRGCCVRRATRFVKSRYARYYSVSDMLDELGWPHLSQERQRAWRLRLYQIINGLSQVPFEGVLIEAYKDTKRKHNMKFRQIGYVIQLASMDSHFSIKLFMHGTGMLSLKLHNWLYLGLIFFKISVHPFRIISYKGPAEYCNRDREVYKGTN